MPGQNLAAWRSIFEPVFDLVVSSDDGDDFFGTIELYPAADLLIGVAESSPLCFERALQKVISSNFDHILARFVVSGELQGEFGAKKVVTREGNIVLVDLAQPCRIACVNGDNSFKEIVVWMPRRALAPQIPDTYSLHGLMLEENVATSHLVQSCAQFLRGVATRSGQIENFSPIALSLKRLINEAILNSDVAMKGPRLNQGEGAYADIMGFIDNNVNSAHLSVDDIAKSLGVSRASLYRLFAPAGGIAQYVKKIRLRAAFDEITAPRRAAARVKDIAFRAGFKNLSAFSRAFRQEYAVSPRQARLMAARGSDAPLSTGFNSQAGLLAEWLQGAAGQRAPRHD